MKNAGGLQSGDYSIDSDTAEVLESFISTVIMQTHLPDINTHEKCPEPAVIVAEAFDGREM
jgi:hypothetical protein